MVNCTPPWLTEDEALWCQDEHWFSSTESMKQFSDHLISLNFKPVRYCPPPCKYSRFEINNRGFTMGDRVITYLTFDDVIEKTYVERQIGPLTFISRVGGFIGMARISSGS